MMAAQDDYTRYTIRIPASLYDAVKEAAVEKSVSVNAEVISRLGSPTKTLRDEFAMAAISALVSRHRTDVAWGAIAPTAYALADAMLAARSGEVE